MAKGDVTFTFDANTAAFIQAIEAARAKMFAAGDTGRKMGEDINKGAEKAAKSILGMAANLGLVTTAAGVALFGINALIQAHDKAMQKSEQRSVSFLGRVNALNQALAASGQVAAAPKLRLGIKSLSDQEVNGRRFSEDEITQSIVATSRSVKQNVSPEVLLDAAGAFRNARAGGMGAEDANAVAINYANMINQGMNPKDAEYYGSNLAKYAGQLDDVQLKFLSRSKDKEQASRLIAAAAQRDENGKTLVKLQTEGRNDPAKIDKLLEHPRGEDKIAIANLKRGAGEVNFRSPSDDINAFNDGDESNRVAIADQQITSLSNRNTESSGLTDVKQQEIFKARRALFEANHSTLNNFAPDWYIRSTPSVQEHEFLNKRYGREVSNEDASALTQANPDEIISVLREAVTHLNGIENAVSADKPGRK